MKVIHVNTYSTFGGATRACARLHQALLVAGHDSTVHYHFGENPGPHFVGPRTPWGQKWAKFRTWFDLRPLYAYTERDNPGWSINRLPSLHPERINRKKPDIVVLHGLAGGMISIADLRRIRAPLVWVLHDMLPFTGGCHYAGGCTKFHLSCGACPQLHSQDENDLTHWIWKQKNQWWPDLNLTLISPSHWLAGQACQSSLFTHRSVEVIPNTLNLKTYTPLEQRAARSALRLPLDKKILLCGAVDLTGSPRKGFTYLIQALQKLQADGTAQRLNLGLAVFAQAMPAWPGLADLPVYFLGTFSRDEDLAQVYSAADVFVAPSLEDNLPNTLLESLACGTPVAAFRLGGFPDLIDHQVNGWLAAPLEADDLARGLVWLIENSTTSTLRKAARAKAEAVFAPEKIVPRYETLFMRAQANR